MKICKNSYFVLDFIEQNGQFEVFGPFKNKIEVNKFIKKDYKQINNYSRNHVKYIITKVKDIKKFKAKSLY